MKALSLGEQREALLKGKPANWWVRELDSRVDWDTSDPIEGIRAVLECRLDNPVILRRRKLERISAHDGSGRCYVCDDRLGRYVITSKSPLDGRNEGHRSGRFAFCGDECFSNWMCGLEELIGRETRSYGASWDEQREKAIERDGGECQRCGMERETHQRRFTKDINVHHKIPFKIFGEGCHQFANGLWNLITVCLPCHRVVEPRAQRRLHGVIEHGV